MICRESEEKMSKIIMLILFYVLLITPAIVIFLFRKIIFESPTLSIMAFLVSITMLLICLYLVNLSIKEIIDKSKELRNK